MWWAIGWSASALAQTTSFEAGDRYRPTAEVLAALGAADPTDYPEEVQWGAHVNARLATELECGALKFDVDIDAMMDHINDLPQELAGMGVGLANALPMLALCHLSPSICAEIKNLNLRIDQDLDFRAAMCESIDKYIDKQADEGERIRRDAAKLAEQQCIMDGGGGADAVRACTEGPQSGLVTDIAKGFLTEELARGPQLVVEAALDATNTKLGESPALKDLLTGIAGEAEIAVNGEVYPLLKPGSLTSEDIREALLYWGEHYTCSQFRLRIFVSPELDVVDGGGPDPYPSAEHAVATLKSVLTERLTKADVDNLESLPWATYRAFCMGLRNTVARESAVVMRDQVTALTQKAEENPELPSLGKSKLRQARLTMEAVVTALAEDSQVMDFATWSKAVADAAASELGHQRAMAETLRRGDQGQDQMWRNQRPCASYLECAEGP